MKKILKYIGLSIVVLTVVFFSAGLLSPSITYESRVVLSKPVDTTFAAFTNSLKLIEWIPGLEGIGWISGNQNEVGSKWKFIIFYEGTKYEMIQTLNGFKPNELFAFNTSNDMFSNDVEVKFISKGATSEIVATSHLTGKSLFWSSTFFFGRFFFTKQDQAMYDRLKVVVEKGN